MFSEESIKKAFQRQNGRCALCGKRLVLSHRTEGQVGAWAPCCLKQKNTNSPQSVRNYVLLCINRPDCHGKIAHNGNAGQPDHVIAIHLPYLNGSSQSIRTYPGYLDELLLI